MRLALFSLIAFTTLSACDDTTGQPIITFTGQAGGAADLVSVPFTAGSGYTVTLTTARLHVGAVYLNQYNPASGAATMPCVLDGIYVAQLFGPVDLDLLSKDLVSFPEAGTGTQTLAHTAQVWLLEGDINNPDSDTHVLELAGTAVKGLGSWPFTATVTIGANRLPQVTNASEPGANPICQQRIVTPVPPVGGALTPTNGGQLQMRVDVRHMLDAVQFAELTTGVSPPPAPPYVIPDQLGGISDQLFEGLRASLGVYAISYEGGQP